MNEGVDELEGDLRAALARQVAAPPPLAGLGDAVVRRGRRVRRVRTGLGVGGAVAAVAALALLLPSVSLPTASVAAVPGGPPRVPLHAGQAAGSALYDWPGGQERRRLEGSEALVLAEVDGGVLVVDGASLGLLAPDAVVPTPLREDLRYPAAAVARGGDRATVLSADGDRQQLVELALPTGEVLRTVPLAPPLVDAGEPVVPVAYSGQAVLVVLGEGDRQRSALWEAGPDQVVGVLEGYRNALGGDPGADERGRAAFRVEGRRCGTVVVGLQSGEGGWELCRETFAAFSPDGEHVLSVDAVGDGLLVRDADDGDLVREIAVPQYARGYGWEGGDTTLHVTVDEDQRRTLVVRCGVARGECVTAASFPWVDRVPLPVPAS